MMETLDDKRISVFNVNYFEVLCLSSDPSLCDDNYDGMISMFEVGSMDIFVWL